jgi:hypothetical protein
MNAQQITQTSRQSIELGDNDRRDSSLRFLDLAGHLAKRRTLGVLSRESAVDKDLLETVQARSVA